jgi:phosphoribosyl-ATP pyrophosphohydrolase/phosphoribosyl-AMP cyclohydrolase
MPSTFAREDNPLSTSNIEFLQTLEDVIVKRRHAPAENSYTSALFAAGNKRIAQKVGEEAVELAIASVSGDRAEAIEEAADLVYHLLVLLNNQDIKLADIVTVLETRHFP